MIPYSLHSIGDEEIQAVTEVMRSGWLTGGPKVAEFEVQLAQYVGTKHAVAVNSGAGALYLAVKALFPTPGGKIAVPTLTYVATANAVILAGHIPVFCDVDPDTFCIDPAKIPNYVDGVIPVHYGGHPCLTSKANVIIKMNNEIMIKTIEEIFQNLPDFILSRDNGDLFWATIKGATQRDYTGDIIEIRCEDKIIEATPNHEFYTKENGWVNAEHLTNGLHLNEREKNEKSLKSCRNQSSKTNLSNGEIQRRNTHYVSSTQMETNQGKSTKTRFENEKACVVSASICAAKSYDRNREGLFGWNRRWGGDDLSLLSSQIAYYYPPSGDIQYKQGDDRLYYQDGRFLATSLCSSKGKIKKALLYNKMAFFPNNGIDRSDFPISPGQKRTGRDSDGILPSSSGTAYRDEVEFKRLFGSSENPNIKWAAITSIKRIPFRCSVFDIITSSGNFFANNFLVHNCDLDAIRDAGPWEIIEDAAHAAGAEYKGKKIGSRNTACFSFHPCKNMTTAEGGMITTEYDTLADQLRRMRLNGIAKDGVYQDMIDWGFKFNMNEISAAIGIEQLKKLDRMNLKRALIGIHYDEAFGGSKKIKSQSSKFGGESGHLYPILVENRDGLAAHLLSKGIITAIHYKPIHLMGWYREKFGHKEGDFPIAEEVAKHILSIPIYPDMTDEQVDFVIQSIKEFI